MKIKDRLIETILSFTPYERESIVFDSKTNLSADLGFTSINFIQLFIVIEAEFGVKLENEYLENENIVKYSYLLDTLKDKVEEVDYE